MLYNLFNFFKLNNVENVVVSARFHVKNEAAAAAAATTTTGFKKEEMRKKYIIRLIVKRIRCISLIALNLIHAISRLKNYFP